MKTARQRYLFAFVFLAFSKDVTAQDRTTLIVEVRSGDDALKQVEVTIGDETVVTDSKGVAVFQVPPGEVDIRLERYGFTPKTVRAAVVSPGPTRLHVELQSEVTHKEEITVTATRTDKLVEDEPLHVEVVDEAEVAEKTVMTPGDVTMLLNETSGVRVQVTSPSLGAANVRIQGLRGRYTQILADGLPLYGGQTGGIGILQIPPLDLRQVEVLKGVASALYGPSALGGVINFVSRSPQTPEHEMLLNRSSRGGTDSVFWLAEPKKQRWGYSLLGGGHFHEKTDVNRDGWADLPSYRRTLLRPRISWDNGTGQSVFTTIGVMTENREGGTMPNRKAPDGLEFPETLRTQRFDGGMVGRFTAGGYLLSVRASAMMQQHRYQFGSVVEHNRSETLFGEVTLSGTRAKHTWVIGSALQTDRFRARDVPRFNYIHVVPGVFVQDDFLLAQNLTISGSARLDRHNKYGTFFDPRLSALLRLPHNWVARASAGTGVFVPTPFTEETEAVGLSRLIALTGLKAERAKNVSADLGWTGANVEVNGSLFGSQVRHPLMLIPAPAGATGSIQIVNSALPTRTLGSELLFRFHEGPYSLSVTHTYVHSTELSRESGVRAAVPLTPRYTAGIDGAWKKEAWGRVGVEFYYTGRQKLEENPYRETSIPYWLIGALFEKRLGPFALFVNAENLGNVRQTRHDPLVRPTRNFDGRWTVDEWAPLDGRNVNGGLRLRF